jgi:hypothetical protein
MNLLTSIDKCSQTQLLIFCIATRCFYIASLYNDMFRPLYWPSSGCTISYFKVNYTIDNVFVNEISCTAMKSAFKLVTIVVELNLF